MNIQARPMLLTNTYAPYREPVWRALADKVERLDVVLLREQETNRNWDVMTDNAYTIHTLGTSGFFLPWIDSGLYWGGGIRKVLATLAPTHLIVAGYSAPPFIEAILWARKHGVPVIQWYESHALSSRFNRGPIRWLREAMLRRADAWVVPGVMSRDYLVQMGIPSESILIAPNTVDISVFAAGANKSVPNKGPVRFLYVGRYIELKGVDLLLDAFKRTQREATLRLVGYGPLESELREKAKGMVNVEFQPATRNPQDTAEHYAWADVVVMPSTREVWGLVINEALAAGCYALSSSVAAVTPDLVENAPLNVGRSIDPFAGPGPLTRAMDEAIEDIDAIRARRGDIANWGMRFTPGCTAAGLRDALLASTNSSHEFQHPSSD